MQGVFAMGAILVSHPFEVARVLIVNNGEGSVGATLKSLYQVEGVAGLYRGFVPRSIHLLPALMTLNYFTNPRNSWIVQPKIGFSEKQSGLAHI
jgi:Mitochondrial carrier protein